MEKEKNSKNTLIVLAIILAIVIFIAGFFLIGGSDEPAFTLEGAGGLEASVIGPEALKVISSIEALDLNDKLFNNPNFIGFKDTTVEIDTEEVGRDNPFSPIR